MARSRTTWPVWLRRISQGAFLTLFLYLFLEAVYHPVNQTGRGVDLFFQIDPLALLSSWLASHQVVAALLLSLITLGVTLLAGRWFCGWICPFGTLHNVFTAARAARVKKRIESGGYSRWQRSKYYVLVALLVGCVLGLNLTGWLDPFSFLYRSLATVVYPMVNDGIVAVFGWIYQADPGVGPLKVTAVSEPVYEVLRRHFLATAQPHFYGTLLLAILFFGILLANLYRSRFWCRYACPLGGLLGVVGKNPLVQIRQDPETCNNCRACVADCQGGAEPNAVGGWKASECLYCWNCHSTCPHHAITFTVRVPGEKNLTVGVFFRWIKHFFRPPEQAKLNLKRRGVVFGAAAGVGSVLLVRTSALGENKTFSPGLIRPPGSLGEDEFLSKCIRCGECMKACPTNAVQPALTEGGFEGLWTPVLKMRLGYCEYECNLCSQVCPTHAIQVLPLEDKQKVKIGMAFFDRNRCLPYASARTCIVCEEHCPTPKKAIWFEEVEVMTPQGTLTTVKQPRVDPELCTGCGVCENKCPISDQRGVYVTSVGETRNPKNQLLLGSDAGYGSN